MLEKGTKAPDFTLKDQEGKVVSLSYFLGQKVELNFFAKAADIACLKQKCFSEGIVVIAITPESVAENKKRKLTFLVLSDPDLAAICAYDVWKQKNAQSWGILRATYLIDELGVVSFSREH